VIPWRNTQDATVVRATSAHKIMLALDTQMIIKGNGLRGTGTNENLGRPKVGTCAGAIMPARVSSQSDLAE
jgi:hypothetical protein